jgi:ATP-binding cassette subfamily F protein 3
MPLLTLVNIHHAFGTDVVLDGAGISVEQGEKLGLVGRNGTGKTTLLRIMQGTFVPDSGDRQVARGTRIGYLSQDPQFNQTETLRGAAEAAFSELHRLHLELTGVFHDMETAEGRDLEKLLRKQAQLEAAIQTEGGYAIDHRIDATLHGLGFTDDQFKLPVTALSGGQLGRLGLARLLLEAPDLLLLDEPTNHLDISGREWLEEFLAQEFPGAVVIVSHDRWLLDRVVGRIVELDQGVARDYPGNYSAFQQIRLERKLVESRVYEKQLDRIRHEERFIARYKAGQRAKQARGRLSRLERFKRDELVDRPIELDVIDFKLPVPERSGDLVAVAEGISKRYDSTSLFDDFSITIKRGERIGIVGPNGAGKTTLARCILGEIPVDAGRVRLGSRLSVGYYRQSHSHLDLSLTVWQYLQANIVGVDAGSKATEQQARDLAGAFLFSGRDQEKVLGDLSGGERSRAVLAGLMGSAHNLLVLDEPTNHLDIPSAERLELALAREGGYAGTVILISHDRAILEATCDRLIVFTGGGAQTFEGTYSEWRDRQRQGAKARLEKPAASTQQSGRRGASTGAKPARSSNRESTPDVMPLDRLEARIEALETRIRQIDELMLDPEIYTDGERCRDLQRERGGLHAELEPLEFEWSRRADDV